MVDSSLLSATVWEASVNTATAAATFASTSAKAKARKVSQLLKTQTCPIESIESLTQHDSMQNYSTAQLGIGPRLAANDAAPPPVPSLTPGSRRVSRKRSSRRKVLGGGCDESTQTDISACNGGFPIFGEIEFEKLRRRISKLKAERDLERRTRQTFEAEMNVAIVGEQEAAAACVNLSAEASGLMQELREMLVVAEAERDSATARLEQSSKKMLSEFECVVAQRQTLQHYLSDTLDAHGSLGRLHRDLENRVFEEREQEQTTEQQLQRELLAARVFEENRELEHENARLREHSKKMKEEADTRIEEQSRMCRQSESVERQLRERLDAAEKHRVAEVAEMRMQVELERERVKLHEHSANIRGESDRRLQEHFEAAEKHRAAVVADVLLEKAEQEKQFRHRIHEMEVEHRENQHFLEQQQEHERVRLLEHSNMIQRESDKRIEEELEQERAKLHEHSTRIKEERDRHLRERLDAAEIHRAAAIAEALKKNEELEHEHAKLLEHTARIEEKHSQLLLQLEEHQPRERLRQGLTDPNRTSFLKVGGDEVGDVMEARENAVVWAGKHHVNIHDIPQDHRKLHSDVLSKEPELQGLGYEADEKRVTAIRSGTSSASESPRIASGEIIKGISVHDVDAARRWEAEHKEDHDKKIELLNAGLNRVTNKLPSSHSEDHLQLPRRLSKEMREFSSQSTLDDSRASLGERSTTDRISQFSGLQYRPQTRETPSETSAIWASHLDPEPVHETVSRSYDMLFESY